MTSTARDSEWREWNTKFLAEAQLSGCRHCVGLLNLFKQKVGAYTEFIRGAVATGYAVAEGKKEWPIPTEQGSKQKHTYNRAAVSVASIHTHTTPDR